jgi:putative ABC transport system permease protein
MVTSYLLIAYRNIVKRKLYSFINAFGLSIGIAFCLLIYLFIADEKSFDQFHVNKESIYRVDNKHFALWAFKNHAEEPYENIASFPAALAPQIRDEIGGIKASTRYCNWFGVLRNGDKIFNTELTGVDPDFFKMFSFELISGNREKLFKNNNEIVLTQDAATKYFGSEDPLGKIMVLDVAGEHTVTVAGVIEQSPANSSITYGVLLPAANLQSWLNEVSCKIFLQLDPPSPASVVSSNLNTWIQKVNGDMAEFRKQQNIPDEIKINDLYLTKLTDIHLDTNIKEGRTSDPKYSFILGGIALLVLIIACINYIALALTSSSTRKTEVGIRKASGAAKNELAFQFSIESLALAFWQ